MNKYCFLLIFLFLSSFSLRAQELRPYTVFLKKGTLLKKLKDNSEVILSKGIYAKVQELNPKRRDRFYVYDQKGTALYETSAEGVIEIADDIRLLPDVEAERIYPPRGTFKSSDTSALFESQVNLHFDSLQTNSFNVIYGDQISNVLSNRYEVRTLYVSDLPFKFGLGLNYQSAYWKNDFELVKLSILSAGPQFKYNFYKSGNYNAHAILGAELALSYEGSTETFKDRYSAQFFDLGVESEWNSPLGILTLGSHFRHHAVTLTESNRTNLNLMPKEFSVNSLGIMFGYKVEWEL